MKKLKTLLTFAVCMALSQAAGATELWVGESYICDASSSVVGLTSDITWTSSSSSISLSGSDFSREAVITNYFSGEATVTCTWKFRLYSTDEWETTSKSWTLACLDNPLSVSPTTMVLGYSGDSGNVTYSYAYSNDYASAATVTFSSSNTSVATVDESGKVTGLSEGTATITCRSNISANSAKCVVTVKSIEPTGISLPADLQLKYGASFTFAPVLSPDHASSDITYSSSDPSVAYVNSSGRVLALSAGEAVITATTVRGGCTAECTVTVLPKPTHFIVCLKDGQRLAYKLADRPRVVADGDNVTLTDGSVTIECPLASVSKYLLDVSGGPETKIAQTKAQGAISHAAGSLVLSGFAAGTAVSVYDAGGKTVSRLTVEADGRLEISVSSYPAGMYIVKAASQTFKFIKR